MDLPDPGFRDRTPRRIDPQTDGSARSHLKSSEIAGRRLQFFLWKSILLQTETMEEDKMKQLILTTGLLAALAVSAAEIKAPVTGAMI